MFRSKKPVVSISIATGALESIFDECDQYNVDETGGRLIGIYSQKGAQYDIQVLGVIAPGPNAQRSPTSFFQDGDYQEKVFRSIEERHPKIEHLGNWHTHHVNGYPTLSGGDNTTYLKIVNHEKHNTDFFYALLVVRRNPDGNPRYEIKHYLFRRHDEAVYEIPADQVRLVDIPVLWPLNAERATSRCTPSQQPSQESAPNLERAKDQEFFSEFYPNLKALYSKSIGAPYWKGSLGLVDGSHVNVVAIENSGDGPPSYSITLAGDNSILADVSATYQERRFRSARDAVLHLERDLNKALYCCKKG
jgi:hypothetical protein